MREKQSGANLARPGGGTSARSEEKLTRNFWVLKIRSAKTWENHWQKLKTEQVVAIGWEHLSIDPSNHTRQEVAKDLNRVCSDNEVGRRFRTAGKILNSSTIRARKTW